MSRNFRKFGPAIRSNLEILEHYSKTELTDGDFSEIDYCLIGAISAFEKLPKDIQRYFSESRLYRCGRHEKWSPSRRISEWEKIAQSLSESLDTIEKNSP